MDLRSKLVPGDLFVSYWLDQHLTIIVGDHRGIASVETVAAPDVLTLITEFEKQVTEPDYYRYFIAERVRPCSWSRSTG